MESMKHDIISVSTNGQPTTYRLRYISKTTRYLLRALHIHVELYQKNLVPSINKAIVVSSLSLYFEDPSPGSHHIHCPRNETRRPPTCDCRQ